MRKLILSALALSMVVISCNKEEISEVTDSKEVTEIVQSEDETVQNKKPIVIIGLIDKKESVFD